MSLFGNLCLAGSVLCLLGLFNLAFVQRAPGGDAGVGHAWLTFMLIGVLLVCAALTTVAVGLRGGFERFGQSTGARALVGVAWFALAAWGMYHFASPGTYLPLVVRMAGTFALPVLMLAWAAVHLNDGLGRQLPAGTATALTLAVAALACLPLASMVVGSVVGSVMGSAARHVAGFTQPAELGSFDQGLVQQIEATNAQEGIVGLLVHTPKGRHPVIRERALAKIKSRIDWQEELARLLQTQAASEVLAFLASNEVADHALFAAAMPQGLAQVAIEIRRSIHLSNHPSNLYAGMKSTEVRLALEVASVYQARGVDLRAAVQEMKRAFDEPTPYDKPTFSAVAGIDRWLAKNVR